jgi:hypothetical protein
MDITANHSPGDNHRGAIAKNAICHGCILQGPSTHHHHKRFPHIERSCLSLFPGFDGP